MILPWDMLEDLSLSLWETFFACLGGRASHKKVSQILATISCSSEEIARKTLSVRKIFIGYYTLR